MNPEQFFIFDAHSMFWRAYHAPFRNLSCSCARCRGKEGRECSHCNGTGKEPTKAVWQFTQQLIRTIRSHKPSYVAVVMDGPRASLRRRKLYPKYKANRPEHKWDVAPQLKRVKQIVRALGLCLVECEGYEADDAIATLAKHCVSDEVEVIVVSPDKDLRQLCVDPRCFVLDPVKGEWHSDQTAGDKWGIKTSQITDLLILMGDSADNIPGVPGFGEKTAVKMLKAHTDIQNLIVAATMGLIPHKLAEQLCTANATGKLDLARSLVTLDSGVSLNVSVKDLECDGVNLKKAAPIFRELNFRKVD